MAGQLLLIPLSVLIITQLIKVAIDMRKQHQPMRLAHFTSYGGMPSSHSALFVSLVVVALLQFGWTSFEFVVSLILYLTVVRDAVGIRWHLGQHGAILKQLIQEHLKDHNVKIQHDNIVTRLGHTPAEATVGTLLGSGLTLILYAIIN